MIRLASSLMIVLALGAATLTSAADATRTSTYSGAVVTIDPQGGVMILDEVGPWQVKEGQTVVTRRTIGLTPATIINTFIRVNVPGRFGGDFIEVPLDAADVTPGDFATAECRMERGRLVAVRVTLAELR